MSQMPVYILGGYQSDFARNWAREELGLFDMFSDTVQRGMASAQLDPTDIEVGHVGNFVGDRFTGQAHLGGFFGHVDPAMAYVPRGIDKLMGGSRALVWRLSDFFCEKLSRFCPLVLIPSGASCPSTASSSRLTQHVRRIVSR